MRLSFPRKLELIDAAGLFSLSILITLNEERNLVEHDYRVPAHPRAREALDVVRLWLLATRRLSESMRPARPCPRIPPPSRTSPSPG
jgi:hypothetical protein